MPEYVARENFLELAINEMLSFWTSDDTDDDAPNMDTMYATLCKDYQETGDDLVVLAHVYPTGVVLFGASTEKGIPSGFSDAQILAWADLKKERGTETLDEAGLFAKLWQFKGGHNA